MRPLVLLENFLGLPRPDARVAVQLHRVAAVAVRESQHFAHECGVILDLDSVRARRMARVPFGFGADVYDDRTSALGDRRFRCFCKENNSDVWLAREREGGGGDGLCMCFCMCMFNYACSDTYATTTTTTTTTIIIINNNNNKRSGGERKLKAYLCPFAVRMFPENVPWEHSCLAYR